MPTERNTNVDFALMQAQEALRRELVNAAALSLYCDYGSAAKILSMKPRLLVEHDLTQPPDTGYIEVLERYLSRVYGGRDDIRVVALLARSNFTEVVVGIEYWNPKTEESTAVVPNTIVNIYEECHYEPRVYILHDSETGQMGELWVGSVRFTGPQNISDGATTGLSVHKVPPKVYCALAGILAAERDPSRMQVRVDDDKKMREFTRTH